MAFGEDDAKDRATCAEKGIHYCETGNPYPGKGRCYHPRAREVGDQEDGYPGGDWVKIECPVCGTRWKRELPQ